MIRVAVVGLGVIAPWFLRAIEQDPRVQLVAVCDRDPGTLGVFGPGVARFASHEELLESGCADAVVVTLPNDAHAAVVEAALEAGVHVCCEKPLAVDPRDAERLTAVAARTGTTLLTASHRRHNRHVQRLARQLPPRSDILSVTARYHERIEEHSGHEAWYTDRGRCGGGCLIDNGPNAIDALMTVLGDLEVTDATIGDVRAGVEYTARVSLRTPDHIPVTVELDWALPTGEVKDIVLELRDGTTVTADMLEGFPAFKSSLDHEYAGIVAELVEAIQDPGRPDRGARVVRLIDDAYGVARSKEERIGMVSKREANADLIKVLFHRRLDRGMTLAPFASRCVRAGEIHELLTTTDRPHQPGQAVDAVGFLGFAEFSRATVLNAGDEVWLNGRRVGQVAGFDECHFPNHYNVIIDAPSLVTGEDLDLQPGSKVSFVEAGTTR